MTASNLKRKQDSISSMNLPKKTPADTTDIAIFLTGTLSVLIVTLATTGGQIAGLFRVLIQAQITVFGVFASLLLASLSGIDNTRTTAQAYQNENRARNVLVLLGISIFYSSIAYLLITSTLTWRPLIRIIDPLWNAEAQIGILVSFGAGLAAISLGRLGRTVLEFLDLYANPSNVIDRLIDSIDLKSISSDSVLSTADTAFATLHRYVIISIKEGRIESQHKGIEGIESITEELIDEIENTDEELNQLFPITGRSDDRRRDELLEKQDQLVDSLEGVVESWEQILSASVVEEQSYQLRMHGYTIREYFEEIFIRSLPQRTFDPLRDLVSSLLVSLVIDDENRTYRHNSISSRISPDVRDQFFHEYLLISSQSSALNPRNTSFRRQSYHVDALQSLYDAIDIGMGLLERDSDSAVALARDAVCLYGTLLHERESLHEVGEQYDRPEGFTESVYGRTQTALLRTVQRDLNHIGPFSSADQRVWLSSLIVLANEAAAVPEHDDEDTTRLFEAFVELGMIGEQDSRSLGKALAIVDVNQSWRSDSGKSPIEMAFANLMIPTTSRTSPVLTPWEGWSDGIVLGPSGEKSRYSRWVSDQRDSIKQIQDTFESERNSADQPPLVSFISQRFETDDATYDLLDDLLSESLNG